MEEEEEEEGRITPNHDIKNLYMDNGESIVVVFDNKDSATQFEKIVIENNVGMINACENHNESYIHALGENFIVRLYNGTYEHRFRNVDLIPGICETYHIKEIQRTIKGSDFLLESKEDALTFVNALKKDHISLVRATEKKKEYIVKKNNEFRIKFDHKIYNSFCLHAARNLDSHKKEFIAYVIGLPDFEVLKYLRKRNDICNNNYLIPEYFRKYEEMVHKEIVPEFLKENDNEGILKKLQSVSPVKEMVFILNDPDKSCCRKLLDLIGFVKEHKKNENIWSSFWQPSEIAELIQSILRLEQKMSWNFDPKSGEGLTSGSLVFNAFKRNNV